MAIVTAYLKGYQVFPGVLNMKPFGHLFIEYFLEGSEEETRIFRAGPKQGYLYVRDTSERESMDSSLRLAGKRPICLIQKQVNLKVRSRSYDAKLFAWTQFIEQLKQLRDDIINSKTVYGIIFNNSNSVASLGWNFITKQDISRSCATSEFNFIGNSNMSNRLRSLRQMESDIVSFYNVWHKI